LDTFDGAEAGLAALAAAAAPADGTENPPLERAARLPWADDDPVGPVTFMESDSST